jgi:hypothetical protein
MLRIKGTLKKWEWVRVQEANDLLHFFQLVYLLPSLNLLSIHVYLSFFLPPNLPHLLPLFVEYKNKYPVLSDVVYMLYGEDKKQQTNLF